MALTKLHVIIKLHDLGSFAFDNDATVDSNSLGEGKKKEEEEEETRSRVFLWHCAGLLMDLYGIGNRQKLFLPPFSQTSL